MGDNSTTTATQLRRLADLLDANPELPTPVIEARWHSYLSTSADDPVAEVQRIRRALGGTWNKNAQGGTFWLTRREGQIELTIFADRNQVCRRVVTTETATIPAAEAQPERVETREVVEWDCTPVLAAESVSA